LESLSLEFLSLEAAAARIREKSGALSEKTLSEKAL
jgi:hypothetical protein